MKVDLTPDDSIHSSTLAGQVSRSQYVRAMFERIAPRYDLMNRLMSAGQDRAWRREVIRLTALPRGGHLLDLGSGTGDLAAEALHQDPTCRPLAADFTPGMMRIGQPRYGERLDWCAADALYLPFPADSFDGLVSGFLLRNVTDLDRSLREMRRVLKPGGRVVALDTTRPRTGKGGPGRWLLNGMVRFHMRTLIPLIGKIVTGQPEAYRYLPSSSEKFLLAEDLQSRIAAVGFQEVAFRRLMFGTIAIHWARK
jgi:demethylmenaquinone methyltransferase/2-methoxy-6-polyprenyl-1,4-benzoquinol methylase